MDTLVRFDSRHARTLERPDGTLVLVSYATPVAAFVPGRGLVRTRTRHSVTTSKQTSHWWSHVHGFYGVPADAPYTLVDQAEIDRIAGQASFDGRP